jgi:hypothetical protein
MTQTEQLGKYTLLLEIPTVGETFKSEYERLEACVAEAAKILLLCKEHNFKIKLHTREDARDWNWVELYVVAEDQSKVNPWNQEFSWALESNVITACLDSQKPLFFREQADRSYFLLLYNNEHNYNLKLDKEPDNDRPS